MLDEFFLASGFHWDGNDFGFERAVGDRLLRAFQRGDGIIILRLTRELVILRAILGEGAHEPALVIGVLQAVQEHVVQNLAVAHAVAAARAVEQIGGVRHALHAAGDHDVGRARRDEVVREHDGLHAGAAHLVDGGAGRRFRQARAERGLAAGRLALACREHAAEDHFFDVIARESRPLDGGPDRGGAELGRLHVLEVALEAAHRRARRTDDNDGI